MVDRLRLLLAAAERLTVDLVTQDPVRVRPRTETPGYARFVAARENFDVLPILEEDGRMTRYVRRDELEAHHSDVDWAGVEFQQIHPDEIVSAVSPLLQLLDRFERDRPRLFVLGPRRIDGIVTVYDLNQPAAHQFGFALSLIVEAEVGRAIELAMRNEDDELDTDVDERIRQRLIELPEEEFKGARGRVARWERKLKSGEQVRLTRELTFHDKIGLIKELDLAPVLASRCRSPYGDSGEVLLACLRDQVKALRNAVAHDANTLADEWTVWEWMRTSYHLAHDLSEPTTP